MNPVNQAIQSYGSQASTGVFAPIGILMPVIYPEVTQWVMYFDATTNAFNGTIVFEVASQDVAFSTFVAPANIMLNGAASATFTQPAAFAGTGELFMVIQFPLPPWRLRCSAYTSGTLRYQIVGV